MLLPNQRQSSQHPPTLGPARASLDPQNLHHSQLISACLSGLLVSSGLNDSYASKKNSWLHHQCCPATVEQLPLIYQYSQDTAQLLYMQLVHDGQTSQELPAVHLHLSPLLRGQEDYHRLIYGTTTC